MSTSKLTENHVKQYKEDGFVIMPSVLNAAEVADLRRITDDICAGAKGMTQGDDVYDLEDTHTPENPRVRRIKKPYLVHEAYAKLIRDERILEPLRQLLGPSVRLNNNKLNLKAKGYGAPVEWHQDWAFYPHTNDDVIAVGVLLNDVTADNGPLNFLPGSHKGPTYNHHDDGYFCGVVDIEKEGIDLSSAVPCIAPAGSISFHHARTLHGSDANRSDQDRALLFYELSAGDAFPLAGTGVIQMIQNFEGYNDQLLCGEPTTVPRMVSAPIRIPLPGHPGTSSIYQSQGKSDRGVYEAVKK